MLEAADWTAGMRNWNAGRLPVPSLQIQRTTAEAAALAAIFSAVAEKIAYALKGTYGAAGPKETLVNGLQ